MSNYTEKVPTLQTN